MYVGTVTCITLAAPNFGMYVYGLL